MHGRMLALLAARKLRAIRHPPSPRDTHGIWVLVRGKFCRIESNRPQLAGEVAVVNTLQPMLFLAAQFTCSNCGSGDSTATLLTAIGGAVVAIATLGVVMATFKAAGASRDAAQAAARSAQAAEDLLSAQRQPQLIDVPWQGQDLGHDPDRPRYPGGLLTTLPGPSHLVVALQNGVGFCSVPIRNVGPGLAQIRSVLFYVQDANVTHADFELSTSAFSPPDEKSRVSLVLRPGHPSLAAFERAIDVGFEIVVRVQYSAAGSETELETTLIVTRSEGAWRVTDLDFAPRRPANTPFDPVRDWPWERDPEPPDAPPQLA
jgi:hypothetical protein